MVNNGVLEPLTAPVTFWGEVVGNVEPIIVVGVVFAILIFIYDRFNAYRNFKKSTKVEKRD